MTIIAARVGIYQMALSCSTTALTGIPPVILIIYDGLTEKVEGVPALQGCI